jgi:hypothetical protein
LRFTGTGHGAAPCTTTRNDDTSAAARSSSGWFNMRLNMVGTRCVWVTLCSSMRRSVSDADQPSISTTDAPHVIGACSDTPSGAAWYSGPVHRCTHVSS